MAKTNKSDERHGTKSFNLFSLDEPSGNLTLQSAFIQACISACHKPTSYHMAIFSVSSTQPLKTSVFKLQEGPEYALILEGTNEANIQRGQKESTKPGEGFSCKHTTKIAISACFGRKGLPYGGVATQPPSGRRGSRAAGGGSSWTGRGSARDSEPQQRGCEDEKRSEENLSFYLKTCQECEQTGVKKGY
ncbi:MARCO-like protein [Manis javanica]|nr:MARCO-like protein [Manis javanica]